MKDIIKHTVKYTIKAHIAGKEHLKTGWILDNDTDFRYILNFCKNKANGYEIEAIKKEETVSTVEELNVEELLK